MYRHSSVGVLKWLLAYGTPPTPPLLTPLSPRNREIAHTLTDLFAFLKLFPLGLHALRLQTCIAHGPKHTYRHRRHNRSNKYHDQTNPSNLTLRKYERLKTPPNTLIRPHTYYLHHTYTKLLERCH